MARADSQPADLTFLDRAGRPILTMDDPDNNEDWPAAARAGVRASMDPALTPPAVTNDLAPSGDTDGDSDPEDEEQDEDDDEEDDEAAAAEAAYRDKAAAFDINLYEEYSPSKEKNNTKLADLYKKQLNKENVNVVINNVSGAAAGAAGAVAAAESGSSGDDLLVEEDFDDMKANLQMPRNSDRDDHDDRGA